MISNKNYGVCKFLKSLLQLIKPQGIIWLLFYNFCIVANLAENVKIINHPNKRMALIFQEIKVDRDHLKNKGSIVINTIVNAINDMIMTRNVFFNFLLMEFSRQINKSQCVIIK